MISKESISESIREFLDYSLRESGRVRHKDYEIYYWTDDDRVAASSSVPVPSAREIAENPPEDLEKLGALIDALVTDDDIPLIQSENGAIKAFNRAIEELRIESNRGEPYEFRKDPDFWDALHSDKATIEFITPIIGLSFGEDIPITNEFIIRRLTNFEKELMLNSKTLGGGSVSLRRAIRTGNLTHAAVHERTVSVEDGWEGGITALGELGQKVQDAFENLRIALRLIHPEGFQMSNQHIVDRTFYPTVISSQETRGSIGHRMIVDPDPISDSDKIVEYFELLAEANEDEGIRVAIDRLESSYRKVSNADGVVDAVIGIEALLSSGRSGSFQEVRRRAAILSKKKATYSELGRLQNLRNATVHGEEIQVNRDDLQQARYLLSVLIDQVIRITTEKDITRSNVIKLLDSAITETVEERFEELLSEFGSM